MSAVALIPLKSSFSSPFHQETPGMVPRMSKVLGAVEAECEA